MSPSTCSGPPAARSVRPPATPAVPATGTGPGAPRSSARPPASATRRASPRRRAAATTASQNARPTWYWRIFISSPSSGSSSAQRRGPVAAPAVERGAQLGQRRERRRRRGVHDVRSAWPSTSAIDRLHAVEQLAMRSGPATREQPAVAHAMRRAPAGRPRSAAWRSCRRRPSAPAGPAASRSSADEVLAQPRDAAELHGVRDLVERDPVDEVVARRRRARARPRRGSAPTNSRRGGAAGSSRASSYWPSTRRARYPSSAADLRRPMQATPARAGPPSVPRLSPTRLEQRARAAAASTRGSRRPRHRGRRPRAAASAAAGRQAACRRRSARARVARRARRGRRRARCRPAAAGDAGARAARRGPSRCTIGLDGTIAASSSSARARARGDDGRSGARGPAARRASVVAARERDGAAALAHDELRGGGVDGAACSTACAIPSTRAAATWHSEIAIEPIARMRWTLRSRPLDAAARASAGRRTRCATSSSRPSRSRRSGGGVGERLAVRGSAPSPRRAHHSSPGPRSYDEAELDVGHRRAVGDGDRDGDVWAGRAWRSASRRSGR